MLRPLLQPLLRPLLRRIDESAPSGFVPSLNLNFLSGALDPRVTFTRASSATRINSAGLIETVASNAPRFDYDPVTLQPKGLLIEEQRTNLLTYSQEFDNAAWTKSKSTVVSNVVAAPNGSLSADKLVEDSETGVHASYPANYSATNVTLTASIYAKASERSSVLLEISNFLSGSAVCRFNLSSGTFTTPSSTTTDYTGISASIASVGNGWFRCSITATKGSANSNNFVVINIDNGSTNSYTGDGTSGIYIWGAQLEAGSFPTSYIPTTTAAATRAADVAVMTGSNFSSWYRQDEGTLFAEGDFLGGRASSFPSIVSVVGVNRDTDAIYIPWTANNGQMRGAVVSGGTNSFDQAVGPNVTAGTVLRAAIAFKADNTVFASGGSLSSVGTSVTLPTVTTLQLGQPTRYQPHANGHIRRIAYFPRRLANSELQAITS